MLLDRKTKEELNEFFQKIRLQNEVYKPSLDKAVKIEQILAYLESMDSYINKLSVKREITLIEGAAGNCWLSYLVYYYYTEIKKRPIRIHCIDINEKLIEKNKQLAGRLGFQNMHFYCCDVIEFSLKEKVDMVYSLHACDTATDKVLYLGMQNKANIIFSVSCCQQTVKKQMRNNQLSSLTKYKVFKDRVAYMVGDSLRALILEMNSYKVDIFEFVSSRFTDKNVMIRAKISNNSNQEILKNEYTKLKEEFKITPVLENYIKNCA